MELWEFAFQISHACSTIRVWNSSRTELAIQMNMAQI